MEHYPSCYSAFYERTLRPNILKLELEEQILNGGALIGLIGVFLPWLSGEWLGGDAITYSGFGFYTSFLGFAVFFLLLFILGITVIPARRRSCTH